MSRKIIAPVFDYGERNGDLVRSCRDVVKDLRFDATALPIYDLTFTATTNGIELVVDMLVPDRDKPDAVDPIHIWRSVICPWAPIRSNGPEYLVWWMRETIANTIAHEVDESITLRGERVFDPHRALTSRVADDAVLAQLPATPPAQGALFGGPKR